MGLATALPYKSLRLTPAPSARRRGSNGEAEARIPLKINIFLSSQPTQQYIHFHTICRCRLCGRWDWLLRSLSVAPFNACPFCSPQGLERRSRSEDTFENKNLFILATHLIYPTFTLFADVAYGDFLFVLSGEVYLHNKYKQKKCEVKTSHLQIFRVEDGARTHDLRNHNPLL